MQERVSLSKLAEQLHTPEAQRRLERLRSTDLNYYDPDAELEAKPAPEPTIYRDIADIPRPEKFVPSEEERELVRSLMNESDDVLPDKLRAGPQYPYFLRYMKALQKELDKISPGLTPEHLAPYDYQSTRVRRHLSTIGTEAQIILNALSQWRLDCLDIIADEEIHPATAGQHLEPDLFDTPPFLRASDDWKNHMAGQACTSACLRMVFHGIADYPLSQTALGEALISKYRTPIVDDDILMGMLKTPTFRQLSGKLVTTTAYIGTDFERLQVIAKTIKERHADAQVFCMVNLSSRTAGRRTWHASILLAADDEKVAYHDPSGIHGGAFQTEEKASFTKRWAQTYNRARLVIATPADIEQL